MPNLHIPWFLLCASLLCPFGLSKFVSVSKPLSLLIPLPLYFLSDSCNAYTFSRSQTPCHSYKETFPDSVICAKFPSYVLLLYLILFLHDTWYGLHNLYLCPWYMSNDCLPPNFLLSPSPLQSPVNSLVDLTCFVPLDLYWVPITHQILVE